MTPEAKSFTAKDGTELTFLFSHGGLIAVENAADELGVPAPTLKKVINDAAAGRLGCLQALIYGGLQEEQPEITLQAAGALMRDEGADLGKALWGALESAMPKAEGKQNPPRAAKSGTGSRSSPRGSKRA